MFTLIITIHVLACALLIILILIQRGHGGGLVEGLSSIDSMFGTKANTFLTKSTTVLSTMFLFTCLVLAVMSARQSKSLMEEVKEQHTKQSTQQAQSEPQPATQPQVATQPQETNKAE